MAYREEREAGPGRMILIGVAIALVGLGLIVWLALSNPFIQDKLGISPEQRTRHAVVADAGEGDLYRTVQQGFPAEFETAVANIVDAKRGEASDADAADAGRSYLHEALARQQMDVVRAPHAQLAALRHAQLHLLEAMAAAEAKTCVGYVRGDTVPDTDADPKVKRAAIDVEVANWKAAAAGRDHGVQVTSLDREPRDVATFIKAVQAEGMTQAKMRAIMTRGGIRYLPLAEQCAYAATSLRAVDRMPAEQSDRFYRATMRRTS